MPRRGVGVPLFLALLPGLAAAAVWPDMIGPYHRTATSSAALSDRALWDEYGLKTSEAATYDNGTDQFTATAYRLADTTGAMAAFEWQRPPDAKASSLANLAAETGNGVLLVNGNYLFALQGYKPTAAELAPVFAGLRDVDGTPLPSLPGFMPSEGMVANTERYIVGPVGLARFDPAIPPSVAGFHLNAEAAIAAFESPKGPMTLALFNYPTNQIAMQKRGDFQKLPGAMVKRSGPLLAVLLSPPDPDAAERLLAQVRYEAQVTLDERIPTPRDNPGVMLVNIFVLIGILLALATLSGLFVGVFRTLRRRSLGGREEDPMILLHLEER